MCSCMLYRLLGFFFSFFLLDPENSFVINNYKWLAKDQMKAITQFNLQVGTLTFFLKTLQFVKKKKSENIDEKL